MDDKKRHRKPPFLLILVLLIVVAAVALFLGRGFGLGQGGGNADGDPGNSPSAAASDSPAPSDLSGEDITVEVSRSEYRIDGVTVSLDDIEDRLLQTDLEHCSVTVRDNYGSAKAHEELTALLAKYGVSAVTE